MPALIAFIIVLGLAMILFGAIKRDELPRNIARIVDNLDGGQQGGVGAGTGSFAGFGTAVAPAWQDGWKLFSQNGVLYASRALTGQYLSYDPPEVFFACAPGGVLEALIDTRLAPDSDSIKLSGRMLALGPAASGTWYRLSGPAVKALLDAETVSLPFGGGWTVFALPDNHRSIAGTLLAACAAAGKPRART